MPEGEIPTNEYELKGTRYREFRFERDSLKITVRGEKHISDSMLCQDDDEEWYHEEFSNLLQAMEKFSELRQEGWDDVLLSIETPDEPSVKISVSLFRDAEKPVIHLVLNISKLNKSLAEKLNRIQKILTE